MTITVETARVFISSLRSAGRRPNEHGVLVASGSAILVREDEAAAIDAFCGYDTRASHGTQLDAARSLARRTLSPVTPSASPRTRGTLPTMAGYVAGMPDMVGHQDAVLRARIRELIDDQGDALRRNDPGRVKRLESEIRALRARLVR